MHDNPSCEAFERKLVRHCAPTLAGIKPANLFTCRDERAGAAEADSRPAHPAGSGGGQPRADTHAESLSAAVQASYRKLSPRGVRIEVLARRKAGSLVYVYRPDLVRSCLAAPGVPEFLAGKGYDAGSLADCILQLHRHICGTDLQSLLSGECSFPHEIGLFLGYPLQDVVGFIENGGENYLCSGCWKVYSSERDAAECFCRYKDCTRALEGLFDQGTPIEQLAEMGGGAHMGAAFREAS